MQHSFGCTLLLGSEFARGSNTIAVMGKVASELPEQVREEEKYQASRLEGREYLQWVHRRETACCRIQAHWRGWQARTQYLASPAYTRRQTVRCRVQDKTWPPLVAASLPGHNNRLRTGRQGQPREAPANRN